MTNEMYNILIVDNNELHLTTLSRLLSCKQYTLYTAGNGKDAIELARKLNPDLVLLDVLLPDMDGAETCRILKSTVATSQIPVIILTGHSDKGAKVRCLQAGANDFLAKPVDDIELQLRVNNLLKLKRHADIRERNEKLQQSAATLEAKNLEFKAALQDRFSFQNIITTCPAMKYALELAIRVAASPQTTVIIYGESGSGKEVLSRAIHFAGGGTPKGFVAINCAAIP